MNRILHKFTYFGLISLVLLFSCQKKIETQSDLQIKMDNLFEKWDNQNTPGVAVAILKDGDLVFNKGYGMANLEHDILINQYSIFEIASESKQFTSFCIFLLENQGKLSLDDDVRKYLPNLPDYGKTITIKNLIHHTSGLRDFLQLLQISGRQLEDIIELDHSLKLVNNQKQVNFDPGERHLYSNTGYLLLGEIVRKVSGQSLREFAETEIFIPLRMENTHFQDNYKEIIKNRVNSYIEIDSTKFENSIVNQSIPGATDLYTTAEDEIKWINNFYTMQVGEKKVHNRMHELAVLNSGDTITYAGGLNIDNYRGWERIGHGGSIGGFRTYTVRFPEKYLGIVIFSNRSDFKSNKMAMKISDIFMDDKKLKKDDIVLDYQKYKDNLGKYLSEEGMQYELIDSSKLYLKTSSSLKELIPKSDTFFSFDSGYGIVKFRKDDNNAFEHIHFDEKQVLRKYDSISLTQSEMASYVGVYSSVEVNTQYEIVLIEDKLILRHHKDEDVELSILTADQFSSSRYWMGNLIFNRDKKGEIIGFEVNSGRVLHLSFKKN